MKQSESNHEHGTIGRRGGLSRARILSLACATPLLVIAMSSGCNILGPAYFIVSGPPKVEAAYELDKNLKYVVLVDDRASKLPKRSLKLLVGQTAEETLIAQKVLLADRVIPSRAAIQVSASESSESPLSITEIGKRVGADAVIYVNIRDWSLSRDGTGISPSAAGGVKIVDALNNTRIWPMDRKEHSLVIRQPRKPGVVTPDPTQILQVEQSLAQDFGLGLAQLFYTHEARTNVGTTGY